MMKLFRVTTNVNEHRGCKNVRFIWFRPYPGQDARPYAELIQDYNSGEDTFYAEDLINELFTAEEAQALKEYLDREYGDAGTTTINEKQLPIPMNVLGLGLIPVGGGDDVYKLEQQSLPFEAWAYFNLVGCELVGEPGETFREYVCIYNPGLGVFREETQEEARLREKRSLGMTAA